MRRQHTKFPFDSGCSALTHFSKSLAHKQANLKEPQNQNINEQVTTKKIKIEDRFYMISPKPRSECAEGVFQIQSPICCVNFSYNT